MKTRTVATHAQVLPTPALVSAMTLVRLCATLFKLRIGLAIMLAGLGGAVLAAGQWPPLLDTLVLALAVLIAASGAGAFNHWYDRDIDAVMGRTSARPFVNGTLRTHLGWPILFILMMAAGSMLAAWYFSPASGLFVAAGALTYSLVYTVWLKRRTHWNIVIGGGAGSWAVLAGAAAAGDLSTASVLWLTAVLFFWTPSHFWSLAVALQDDYRRAGVPMLPVTRGRATAVRWNVVNTIVLVLCSIGLAAAVGAPLLWITALGGSGWLLLTTLRMISDPARSTAMTAFKASLIQLGLLLVGIFAFHAVP